MARGLPGDKRLEIIAQRDQRCGVPVTGVRRGILVNARAFVENAPASRAF